MSAPPYVLEYLAEAENVLLDLQPRKQYQKKLAKIRRALTLLEQRGPRHPGLHSHPYQSVKGPGGATVWESYVENHTPSAWRIWWVYGPDADTITVITLGPHP